MEEPTIQDLIVTKGVPDLSGYEIVDILLQEELPVLSNDFVEDFFSKCDCVDVDNSDNKSLEGYDNDNDDEQQTSGGQ